MAKKRITSTNKKIMNQLSSYRSLGLITSQHYTSLRGQLVNSPEEVECFVKRIAFRQKEGYAATESKEEMPKSEKRPLVGVKILAPPIKGPVTGIVQGCRTCGGKDEPNQASCRTCTSFKGKLTNWYLRKEKKIRRPTNVAQNCSTCGGMTGEGKESCVDCTMYNSKPTNWYLRAEKDETIDKVRKNSGNLGQRLRGR